MLLDRGEEEGLTPHRRRRVDSALSHVLAIESVPSTHQYLKVILLEVPLCKEMGNSFQARTSTVETLFVREYQ